MVTKLLRCTVVVVMAVATFMIAPEEALAWKPFAHNYTGDQAYADAVDDGKVTIGNHSYPLDPRLVSALVSSPEFYNAGVVGPDGFPDLIYGQSQIHPVHTGKWLQYIVEQAWAAQNDFRYNGAEKEQILAFAYGYLTHAAGDMWGHTLVNDFAGGVFPSFEELAKPDKAKIALRHIIVEGYAGGATPGWDRSQDEDDRAQVCTEPGPAATNCDDVSDDQTHGIQFDAPHKFIYNTLVDPEAPLPVGSCRDGVNDDDVQDDDVVDDGCPGQAFTVGTPEPKRGPLLDFFLDLETTLKIKAAELRKDAGHTDCLDQPGNCVIQHAEVGPISTVRGVKADSTVTWRVCHSFVCFDDPSDVVADEVGLLLADYYDFWIDDIEAGLRDWSKFGLGVTKGLFDPQARRDAQNDECHTRGPEASLPRINCENSIGALDTILFETDDYINGHLLSMMGLPDLAGPIRATLEKFSDIIDAIVGPALNPLRLVRDAVHEAIVNLVKNSIRRATGVDVEEVKEFLEHPTRWMCGDAGVSVSLPGVGTITGAGLFSAPEHARLDAIMGLELDHHEVGTNVSTDCSPLDDDAEYDEDEFAAIQDTITQAKLSMLDGTQLNRALGDALADNGVVKSASLVHTYGPGDNVMFTSLNTAEPWLKLIDGDHAWRQDGLPRFCNDASSCWSLPSDVAAQLAPYPFQPTPRDVDPHTGALLNGGTGHFPIWESCVLRPAFREIFSDWENTANPLETTFPDLGDATSPDSATDPSPPTVDALTIAGPTFTTGGTTFIAAHATFTVSAHDNVFADDTLALTYRAYAAGATPGDFQPLHNGDSFSLPIDAADGVWMVQVHATDPCGGQTHTEAFTLDSHGPQITIESPAPEGVVFDSDDVSTIQFGANDGVLGSGVRRASATLDGALATNGQLLDMFLLTPGNHGVEVTASDNVGNTSIKTRHFKVHATSQSLLNNMDRACEGGLIAKRGTCNSLAAKLRAALSAHNRGQHNVETKILGAFIHEVGAQRGKSVDPATADRLTAFAKDLIQRGT